MSDKDPRRPPDDASEDAQRDEPHRPLREIPTMRLAELAGFTEDTASQVSAAVAAAAKVDNGWLGAMRDIVGPAHMWEPQPLEKRFPELLDSRLMNVSIDPVQHDIAESVEAQVERLDAMTELLSRQVMAQSALLDTQREAMKQSAASQQVATKLTWLGLGIAGLAVVVSLPSAIATVLGLAG
ncbi:hypothetical protein OVA14_08630 [Agrococcus sp. SL85]|uniref:hypothetical protein n=1 Tax=Agrococcus sp. SL85 TaxID=2995141 RepID=UPI00226D0EFF|nr:hypothetical protein [Agrococcus sp. SL85]WAC65433.1 hypothetical protein OVA14_08630 [Agrococcus sp. SL85]